MSGKTCVKCTAGCTCAGGTDQPVCCSTQKACSTLPGGYSGTYNECNDDAGSKCSRSCDLKCSGSASCPSNASCTYNTNYTTTGTQYYNKSCTGTTVKCPVSNVSCNSGYYYSSDSCYSCSNVSYTNSSGTENKPQESEESCETQQITNGTKKRCRHRYRTPYRTYTETCYYTGGAGGKLGSSSCSGKTSCSTKYSDVIYPNWGEWGNYGDWSYSCDTGYSVSGTSCACTTLCSTRNNTTSTRNGTQSCAIANGTGSQSYTETCNGKYDSGCYSANNSSCTGCTSYQKTNTGACTVQSCNTGYTISGNSCACITNCKSVKNTKDTQECTPTNTVANAKTKSCPKGTQTCNGTYTNDACQSANAQCTGCSGYGSCTTSCTAASCNTGYYLSSGACVKCDEGYTSVDGNTGDRYSCYKNCTIPCTPQKCPENATCSNGSETSSGTQKYGGNCDAASKSCTIKITCNAGYYLSTNNQCVKCAEGNYCANNVQTKCPSEYPLSDAGNSSEGSCYKNVTLNGQQLNGETPANCASVTAWNTCNPTSCTYRDYYTATDGSCKPTDCIKSVKSVKADAGYYVKGSVCAACPDGSYCTGGTYTLDSTNQGIITCPNGASGSSMPRSAPAHCYKNCPEKTISGGSATRVTESVQYNAGTKTYPDCTYYVNCNSGYGASGDGTANPKCTQCLAGQYSAGKKATCETCSAGTYTSSAGQSSCKECETDYYCTGGSNHQECTGNTTTNGKTKQTSANACICKAGYGILNGSCTACATGTYKTSAGNDACTSCTPHSTTSGTGKTARTDCLCSAGYSGNAGTGTCTACTEGKYKAKDANGDCTPASQGHYVSGSAQTAEQACAKGSYTNTTGQSSCTKCSGATYQDGTGATSCKSCPTADVGWSLSNGTGWTAVTDCTETQTPANCASGKIQKNATASGTWGTAVVSSALTANTGYYVSSTSCAACTKKPENSTYTSNGGTTDSCQWSCDSGYGQTFQSKCVLKCTAGMSTLHAGEKVAVQLYDTRSTTPSIVIQKGNKMCYVNLVEGNGKNALNVDYKGKVYHTSN